MRQSLTEIMEARRLGTGFSVAGSGFYFMALAPSLFYFRAAKASNASYLDQGWPYLALR